MASPLCTLWWERYEDPESDMAQKEQVEGVAWTVRGDTHYLRYTQGDTESPSELRTTLRIDPTSLTWIRQGTMTWTHTFRLGERHHSRMLIAGQTLDVSTTTRALDIDVRETEGVIYLEYDMAYGADEHDSAPVRLVLRFQQVH